ncbi:MAG: type II secretion system F family protein [Planctomycetota bacterium]|jgi:type IV pilus assembly protein PilC|nr:type II secretion system F family protein [Planctomycetota bacterium]
MAKFKYVARDQSGARVESEIEANNQAAAVQVLRRSRLTVLSIAQAKKGLFDFNIQLSKTKPRARSNDLMIFTRQFSTMVEAGLAVVEILDILHEQTDDPGFKMVINDVKNDVRSGTDLSSALGKFPKVFTPLYVNLIRAGERSGDLDIILKRLAGYIEKSESLKRKIKSAMMYPAISILMVLGITAFLLIYIVPQFVEIFEKMGVDLPLPTRIVMFISSAMTSYWYVILALIGGFAAFVVMSRKSMRGRYLWDAFYVKMPVFGELVQKVALSRFARTFSTMLQSGVPMLESLEIVATSAGNGVVEEAVLAAREGVRQGEPLASPLALSSVFPPMVVRMIQVGERTGALETLLEKVADFYDEQVDAAVESLTSVIEPVMIGVMGVLVGGIVIAIFVPIFEIQNSVGRRR